jgi:type IV secretory pathway VirD2 relaxase
VKVLTRGAVTPTQVRAHAEYIGRDGELDLETDDGQRLTGDDAGSRLVEDWDLDLPVAGSAERVARGGGREARLVHKLIFSMPPGTPPEKVLGAVRDFARKEFGLAHRYAMALHTDEPHPHVHLLVKAVSEQGERLNIRKETLRRWRAGFAEQLRARGVAANATERAVRGQSRKALKDGTHRAAERGRSTHVHERLRAAAELVASGTGTPVNAGERRLRDTNERIWAGYRAIADQLLDGGDRNLSDQVRRFADRIRYPSTEQEHDRERTRELLRQRERSRDAELTR